MRCCNFWSVWVVWRAWQTVETFSRAGGQKVAWLHKSLPLHPHVSPTFDLAPREAGGVLALVLMGKNSRQSGKKPTLGPVSQSCRSEWVQLGVKSPSWHSVLPVIFLFSHMNFIGYTNFHQHAVWALTLLCISMKEKTCIGSTNFHQCAVWALTLIRTSVNEISAERWL